MEVTIAEQVKVEQVAETTVVQKKVETANEYYTGKSKYHTRWFGKYQGSHYIKKCLSNKNAKRFTESFREKYGEDVAYVACITLNFENSTFQTDAVSPCWSTNSKQASARKCTYASDNSAGVDAGLFMINTHWQRYRMEKLGAPKCKTWDSRSANDKCNKKRIKWLHNLDNQIKIIMDIYKDNGFSPWVAYNKHVKYQVH